jgi:hypothetical protein
MVVGHHLPPLKFRRLDMRPLRCGRAVTAIVPASAHNVKTLTSKQPWSTQTLQRVGGAKRVSATCCRLESTIGKGGRDHLAYPQAVGPPGSTNLLSPADFISDLDQNSCFGARPVIRMLVDSRI